MSNDSDSTEQGAPGAAETAQTSAAEWGPAESTGHAAVDDVLRTMSGLQDRPVEEHVAIFEAAHERLRTALSEASERPGDPSGPGGS